jgi:hypothetical protein
VSSVIVTFAQRNVARVLDGVVVVDGTAATDGDERLPQGPVCAVGDPGEELYGRAAAARRSRVLEAVFPLTSSALIGGRDAAARVRVGPGRRRGDVDLRRCRSLPRRSCRPRMRSIPRPRPGRTSGAPHPEVVEALGSRRDGHASAGEVGTVSEKAIPAMASFWFGLVIGERRAGRDASREDRRVGERASSMTGACSAVRVAATATLVVFVPLSVVERKPVMFGRVGRRWCATTFTLAGARAARGDGVAVVWRRSRRGRARRRGPRRCRPCRWSPRPESRRPATPGGERVDEGSAGERHGVRVRQRDRERRGAVRRRRDRREGLGDRRGGPRRGSR